MRILYDGYIYKAQKAGGIGRYFNNIIKRLPDDCKPILTTIDAKNNVELPQNNNLMNYNYKSFRPVIISQSIEKYYFRSIEQLIKFDIYHPTYYTMLTDKNLSAIKKPIILTVHDMIFELFNEKLSFAEQHIKWKRDAILAADSIICVSHNTKADLLKYYPQVEKKINVIYEGSELKYENSFGPEDTPGNPYFIYVGSRAGYKNFDLLLYAFSELIKTYKNIFLCIVGPQLSVKEHKLISELGLENNIKCYDFVSSNHLAKLYRCSIALVYPSLYEGFGLPPLEAMTCGTSVITSNVSSIPEVVGDSCILINPELKSDMLESMAFLFRNESERKKLIEKGFVRSTLFDWNKNVAKIVELYKSYK